MYSIVEFRKQLSKALDRALISPVKIVRHKQVFYVLSEKQFVALQAAAIVRASKQASMKEPQYIPMD